MLTVKIFIHHLLFALFFFFFFFFQRNTNDWAVVFGMTGQEQHVGSKEDLESVFSAVGLSELDVQRKTAGEETDSWESENALDHSPSAQDFFTYGKKRL